jgi:glycosyltransferase involved in cell wall biosynthesis
MSKGEMVIVPVYNEKDMLAKAKENGFFEALHVWQERDPMNRQVLFVNDGSKDGSERILEREGFKVIDSDPKRKRNMGKGRAIIEGAKEAHKRSFGICVVLDVDIINLSARKIENFVRDLVKSGHKMVVAKVSEGTGRKRNAPQNSGSEVIGERAFYTDCFKPVWEGTKRKDRFYSFMYKIGADSGIHRLIKNWDWSQVSFSTAPSYRNIKKTQQNRELRTVWKRTMDRANTAEKLWKMRPKKGDSKKVRRWRTTRTKNILAGLKKKHKHLR